MVKETLYCDRCGRECENYRENPGFHVFRNKFYVRWNNNDYMDFCQKCLDELGEWFKEGGNK